MDDCISRKAAIEKVMGVKWRDGADGAMAMEIVASLPPVEEEKREFEPTTNAGHIRAMSDQELAQWLAEWCFCTDVCPGNMDEVEESIGYACSQRCKEQALKWLQQTAEDDK